MTSGVVIGPRGVLMVQGALGEPEVTMDVAGVWVKRDMPRDLFMVMMAWQSLAGWRDAAVHS